MIKMELKNILPIRVEALMSAVEVYMNCNETITTAHTLAEIALEEAEKTVLHLHDVIEECKKIASEG